ncbi:MAG: rane protein insertase YidC, partial [Planctomycetota bacterium]
LIMSGTMFWSQKQMMARNAANNGGDNPMAQQQKILLYVMPVFLAVISINFPVGVVLYWATTNVWQVAQQAIILREVKHEVDVAARRRGGGDGADRPRSPGASSGRREGIVAPSATGDASDGAPDDEGDLGDGGAGDGDARGGPGQEPGPRGGGNGGPAGPRLPRRGGGR